MEKQFRLSDLGVVAVYWAIVWFGILHHEPWSDEALPWIIARDTDFRTFLDIILNNWDRHPGLFHTSLLPFAKLGFPYFTQAILNALLALAAALLFVMRAPFARIFRGLFLFSYFMLYEYSVITRPYMLTITLVFLIAVSYKARAERPIPYAILTALLFHADYMGFGLAAGITLAFFMEQRTGLIKKPRLLAALSLMALSGFFVFWIAHTLPPGHGELGNKLALHFKNVTRPVADAFFMFSEYGWHPVLKHWLAFLSGSLVIVLTFISLAGKPAPLTVLGVSLGYLLTVFTFFHGGDWRNHGFILISIIFSLWIARTYSDELGPDLSGPRKFRAWAAKAAVAIICVCLLLGLNNLKRVYLLEYRLPFSGAENMAKAIKQLDSRYRIFERGFVIVAQHKNSVGLQPYLPGVKFWSPCAGRYGDYYKLTQKMSACNDRASYDAIIAAKKYFGDLSKVLFLLRDPLPVSEDADYYFQGVFAVPKAFGHWNETFFLYLPVPKTPGKTQK